MEEKTGKIIVPLFKKGLLKRKEIAKKFYGYHSKNNINDKKTAITYLNKITNCLNKYNYESDDNFVMLGRKKFIYDEVMDILNGNVKVDDSIYFVLGSLEEFICNDNFGGMSIKDFTTFRDKNDNYIKTGYICLEEKEYIVRMINAIKESMN